MQSTLGPGVRGQKTYAIALADLDGDGDLDGVEATVFGDFIFILENKSPADAIRIPGGEELVIRISGWAVHGQFADCVVALRIPRKAGAPSVHRFGELSPG